MNQNNLSIKEADRQIFRSVLDDGLVDIWLSSIVLMWAVAPYLSTFIGDFWSSAIFVPLWGGLFLVLYLVRKYVVQPRAGKVKFGVGRRKKLTAFTWIMLVLNVLFMVLGIFAFFIPQGPGYTRTLPFSLMILVSFSLAGYFLDAPRFYVYGILWAGGFYVGEWLYQTYGFVHHGYPVTFSAVTLIVFLTGMYKLLTFVRENPLPGDEQLTWEGNNG